MPAEARNHFHNQAELDGVIILLGFLLRAWTIIGELILVTAALIWDWKGALSRPDAPGRVPPSEMTNDPPEPPHARSSPAVAAATASHSDGSP
jgi:hypothetical protein